MTPERVAAVVRVIEIFKRHMRPAQKVVYLAEASGPVQGRTIAHLKSLTYTVGMGGESETLNFQEMIAVFDYIFYVLETSAEAVRTGVISAKPFPLDHNPDERKILAILPRIRLTYSQPS
ncbi:MAG: hypothetical protein ABSD28_06065 [Tepidisphaeraceae bacterium]|jgi:hypothetical protein